MVNIHVISQQTVVRFLGMHLEYRLTQIILKLVVNRKNSKLNLDCNRTQANLLLVHLIVSEESTNKHV